jgi:geranylgeranyl diphosphate synthase type I
VQRTTLQRLPREVADLDRLADVVTETGAVEAVEAMVERRIGTALDALAEAPIDPASRSSLTELAITATRRQA